MNPHGTGAMEILTAGDLNGTRLRLAFEIIYSRESLQETLDFSKTGKTNAQVQNRLVAG
jgi:hypothetical protein